MEQAITFIMQWIVVPTIMLSLYLLAIRIARRGAKSNPEVGVPARAGLRAGLLIFVIYVISQLGAITNPDFTFEDFPSFQLIPILVGVAAGFAFLWIVRVAAPTRFLGLVTLALSATSTSALFTYVFVRDLRIVVLYSTLGAALGIMLHVVLFPGTIRGIFD